MRRSSALVAAIAALALAVAPSAAFARAGFGGGFGSRGMRTFSAPPITRTAPYSAAPIERSITPQSPGYAASPGVSSPYRRGGFGGGLLGGLLGVGLGSMLFGGNGFAGGFLNLLIWLAVLFFVGRWLLRRMARQPSFAGVGNRFARTAVPPGMAPGAMAGGPMPGSANVAISPADYQAFGQVLSAVQAAWSTQDLNRLRQLTTPEMASNFAEQLAMQASRGVRNEVSAVHLDQGDLSEAWSESGREYATVAMRFSMVDVTRDATGRIVDGDPNLRTQATELWTFLRASGGHWILSAIQQAR